MPDTAYTEKATVATLISLEAVRAERERQRSKWHSDPENNLEHSFPADAGQAMLVLGEEVGEVARAVLEHDDAQLELELIQLAAVCVSWIDGLIQSPDRDEAHA